MQTLCHITFVFLFFNIHGLNCQGGGSGGADVKVGEPVIGRLPDLLPE